MTSVSERAREHERIAMIATAASRSPYANERSQLISKTNVDDAARVREL